MTVSINSTSFPDDGRKYGKESKDNNDKSHNDGDSEMTTVMINKIIMKMM